MNNEDFATEEQEQAAIAKANAEPPIDFDCEKCGGIVLVHVPEMFDCQKACPSCGNVEIYFGY